MPIYEYRCRKCGLDFESLQKVSDPPPPCRNCDGEVDKRVSRTSFQLKGAGWYVTDYARKPAPAAAEPGAAASKPAADAGATGTAAATPASGTTPAASSETSTTSTTGSSAPAAPARAVSEP